MQRPPREASCACNRQSTLGQPKPALLPYFYVQARMRIFAQSYQKPEISKSYELCYELKAMSSMELDKI